ncbi:trypco2 family protein [Pannonibacter sp. Q-1]|uniref:Trypsin-co-occurring domain-containing protein n=1 Tax=Pannonibacter phragmitetus TaxID=121719 RepID=A0A0U3PLI0_9HYPH|nr:trypco2 family protein [Pannonibacter phragmitetus]ALV28109.1 hypothetical protein APZ00_14435 [Pannonibacter phragmitetus]
MQKFRAFRMAICLAMALATVPTGVLHAQEQTGVVLNRLLADTRDTLIRVKRDTDGTLKLKQATLQLQTSLQSEASGKIKLVVVSFGSSVASEAVQTLKLVLAPPGDGDTTKVSSTSDGLAEAILAGYTASLGARNATPPLHLKELQTKVKFVVKAEAGASGGLVFLPVTVDLAGKVASSNIQEIDLVFCVDRC